MSKADGNNQKQNPISEEFDDGATRDLNLVIIYNCFAYFVH